MLFGCWHEKTIIYGYNISNFFVALYFLIDLCLFFLLPTDWWEALSVVPVPLSPRPAPPSSALTFPSRWRWSVGPARRNSSISLSPVQYSSPRGSAYDQLGHTQAKWRLNKLLWNINSAKKWMLLLQQSLILSPCMNCRNLEAFKNIFFF